MPMSTEEIEVETLDKCSLDEQRCANHYFVEVDDEHTTKDCSPSTTPTTIEVIEEKDCDVVPDTQCEDAHVIPDPHDSFPFIYKSIFMVWTLPTVLGASGRKKTSEPIIDYSKSTISTLDQCMDQLEEMTSMKVEVDEARMKEKEEFELKRGK